MARVDLDLTAFELDGELAGEVLTQCEHRDAIVEVATIVITFGSRLLSLSPNERLILAPVAIIVLAFASAVSLRSFETPLRRYLTEAFERRAAGPAAAAISRQERPR